MNIEEKFLRYFPLLSPVPTAWSVGRASYMVLHYPLPVAIVNALIIEGLGFLAVNTAMQMREFNKRLTSAEKHLVVPVGQAYMATLLYILTASVMTVFVEINPTLAIYAPLPFIFMSAAGAWLYALRRDFEAKVKECDDARSKTKAEKEKVKAEKLELRKQGQNKPTLQVAGKGSKLQGASSKHGVQVAGARADKLQVQVASKRDKQPVQDDALLAYWRVNPKASNGDVAKHFDVTTQAIQQRRQKLIKNGVIGMNADGVAFMAVDVSLEISKQAVKR